MLEWQRNAVRVLGIKLAVWASDDVRWKSVRLACLGDGESDEASVINKLRRALDFVSTHSPMTAQRIDRKIRCIVAMEMAVVAGEYLPRTRTCLISRGYIEKDAVGPLEIALILVHEAVHASIPIRSPRERRRRMDRIEIAAIRQELRFLQRAPGGKALESWSTGRLRTQQERVRESTISDSDTK